MAMEFCSPALEDLVPDLSREEQLRLQKQSLMQCLVGFRGQVWVHLNFWARSRSSSKTIKRFFAEVHYKPASNNSPPAAPEVIPIVEVCTIIEPLSQYRSSCAFCPGSFDILHPKGSRKFVCGNDKDRIVLHCNAGTCMGKPC